MNARHGDSTTTPVGVPPLPPVAEREALAAEAEAHDPRGTSMRWANASEDERERILAWAAEERAERVASAERLREALPPDQWIDYLKGAPPEIQALYLTNEEREALDAEAAEPAAEPTGDGRRRRPSAADDLLALAGERYTLHRADDGEPFALRRDGPNVAHLFRGGRASLRAALARDYAAANGRVPPAQSLVDVLAVLEGEALSAPRVALPLRAARADEAIVLDMGDEDGRAIVVDRGGWRIVERSPVTFRRSELTGALPDPEPDHGLDALGRLVNVAEDDLPALLAWLIAGLRGVPAPIVLLRGPEGAAKTSAARTLVRLFDPSAAPVRAAPRDLEGWAVAAAGSLFVAIDNISTIPDWLSDALCRAVTGEALVRRALYTDSSLSVVSFRRAIVMTTIDPGAVRGDLADRLLAVELTAIPEERRLDDEQVEAAFAAAHPAILGALLDLTAKVLAILPSVELARRPRMADYARLLAGVDRVLGTDGLPRYVSQRGELQREAAEGDLLGAAIIEFMGGHESWQGTAAELLAALSPDQPPKGWPATARALAGQLRRLVRPLAGAGIVAAFEREGHERRRVVRLARADGSADGTVRTEPYRPHTVRTIRAQADGADGADGLFPTLSGGTADGADASLALDPSRTMNGEEGEERGAGANGGPPERVAPAPSASSASSASSPGAGPTVACSDYHAHQSRHRRVDGRWRCDDCEEAAR